MRILFLSQFFDPEPVLEGLNAQLRLTELGHEVEVLTGFPNYPGGKIYPGYRRSLYRREVLKGITIHRVWLYPSHDRSAVRRVLNYVSFAAMACLVGPFVLRRPQVIWAYHPPLTVGWPARFFKFIYRAPFVYHVHDVWPDTLAATGMLPSPRVLRLVGRWAQRVYRSAARIAVISPGFEELLLDRGVPSEKTRVIYTWCDEGRLHGSERDPDLSVEQRLNGAFVVMFAGTMGFAQALDAVIDAAAIVASTEEGAAVRFVFVGSGVESDRLAELARERAAANVLFVGRKPMEQMGSLLSLADALLIHLKDDPLFAKTVPGKTQTYMYLGIPILAAVRGDTAELVNQAGCGVSCEPESPTSIAEAVLKLASMPAEERAAMGRRGREFYDRELSMEAGVRAFEAIFREAAGKEASL